MSFTLVSKAIHARGITSTEKLVLIALCDFADDKKYQCYPSHASIAEICSLSEMSAIRSIKNLIEKGFISKENRKQKGGYSSNLYTILHDNFDVFQMPLIPQGTVTMSEGVRTPCPKGTNTELLGVLTQCEGGTNTELLGVLTQCEGGTNTESENPITEPIIINQSLNQSNIRKKKSEKNNDDYSEDFEEFWQQYPKKQGKHAAFKAYQKAIKKTDKQKILSGAIFYNSQIHQKQTPEQYIKQASGWLNDQRYNDIPISTTATGANYAQQHQSNTKQDPYEVAFANLRQQLEDDESEY